MRTFSTCHYLLTVLGSLFLSCLLPTAGFAADCDFRVASFNIHYIVTRDGPDEDWESRKEAVTEVLTRIDADIIAFQEMETFKGGNFNRDNLQLDWIMQTVPGYQVAAFGDPSIFPSTQPVLYKPERFTAEQEGFFFYSDEPERIYSRQWDGGYPYFSSWVRLKSGCAQQKLLLINVHNDYSSSDNRIRTSRLVAERVRSLSDDDAVIVLGDFNVRSTAEEISIIEETGLNVVEPAGSTNRILGMHLMPAIDHFIIDPKLRTPGKVRVWRDRVAGEYPSDHYPISLELSWVHADRELETVPEEQLVKNP